MNAYSTSSPSPFALAFSDHSGTQPATKDNSTFAIAFGYNGHAPVSVDAEKEILGMLQDATSIDSEIEGYVTTDWTNDPYARGTWSCWGPMQMKKYLKELQEDLDGGRVCMANSDWAEGWRGFIDGAIERGGVAARTVKQRLSQHAGAKL